MGTFVKVFSTWAPLEIHQLLHKQTCLVSSQSNQRPTMNKSIILAAVAILAQFAGNNVSAASESNKDWCCKVAMVHIIVPYHYPSQWGLLDARYSVEEGLRKEWDNKGCNTLVAKGDHRRNTKNCGFCNDCVTETSYGAGSNNVNDVDWCCATLDLYKGKVNGGFNNPPLEYRWKDKKCSEKVSEC